MLGPQETHEAECICWRLLMFVVGSAFEASVRGAGDVMSVLCETMRGMSADYSAAYQSAEGDRCSPVTRGRRVRVHQEASWVHKPSAWLSQVLSVELN